MTRLLVDWSKGDKAAFDQLVPLAYAELRRLARRHMARRNPGHTLQTTTRGATSTPSAAAAAPSRSR
jgi:hypothetical protein